MKKTLLILSLAMILNSCTHKDLNQTEISQKQIISDFKDYQLIQLKSDFKAFILNKKQTAYDEQDKSYLQDYFYIQNEENNKTTSVTFYPFYNASDEEWVSYLNNEENRIKIKTCEGTYYFNFDKKNLDKENQHYFTNIRKIDLNNDGNFDYLIDGFTSNCSGSQFISESKYIITFIQKNKQFILTDIITTRPEEFTIINNNTIVSKGKTFIGANYDFKDIFNFDSKTNKWKYNEKESYLR